MFVWRACLLVALAAAGVGLAAGQQSRQQVELGRAVGAPAAAVGSADGVAMPDASVGAALANLGSRADVVFVGQVEKIEPKGGVVEVRFAVEQSVVGSVGANYVLREWGGLWTGGRQRYYVGQRAMVFLHAPVGNVGGVAGLSSPVDGMDGVVPVVVLGADAEALVDVRWLATRVMRQVGSPLGGAETGAIKLSAAKALVIAGRSGHVAPEPVRLPLPVRPKPILQGGEVAQERGN